MAKYFQLLALDLGAESGRAVLGRFDGEVLSLEEVHRFSNGPVTLDDGLHWDVLRLWGEIEHSLQAAAHLGRQAGSLAGMGIDTWGVDFGLLDRQGHLIGNPFHYRDGRTDGMLEAAFERLPREEIFAQTGIQFMQLNSLYQLLSMVIQRSPALRIAETFLTMPDLFNYWLTGQKVCEFTNATTTQCYNPRMRTWAWPMLEALEIPTHIFPQIVPPFTVLGSLRGSVAERLGVPTLPVIAPACHDTGSAVAAIPAESQHYAWISSGTWSIVGATVNEPLINAQSLAFNLTNEGGVGGAFRLSKNVMGLWLVQECRNAWSRQGEDFSYDALTQMAAVEPAHQAILDVDWMGFFKPGDMPERIRAYCQATGQPTPESKGALIRCALESIALKYRWILEKLETLLGQRLEPIHIVGGGSKNRLLSQLTADITGRLVISGPAEATITGNLMMQAIGLGELASAEEARQVVCQSCQVETLEPSTQVDWEPAHARLNQLIEQPPC